MKSVNLTDFPTVKKFENSLKFDQIIGEHVFRHSVQLIVITKFPSKLNCLCIPRAESLYRTDCNTVQLEPAVKWPHNSLVQYRCG